MTQPIDKILDIQAYEILKAAERNAENLDKNGLLELIRIAMTTLKTEEALEPNKPKRKLEYILTVSAEVI